MNVGPGQMAGSQKTFIHTIREIRSTWLLDFTFFFYNLRAVSRDKSKSRSNGRVTKGFHPRHIWGCKHMTFGLYIFFNIAKPDQITHLWKGWILRKSWTCVFHCPVFLGQPFLVLVSNLIRLRNSICRNNEWTWIPVKWQNPKGLSSTLYVESWVCDLCTLCFFYNLCTGSTDKGEFRSNGRVTKRVHPHHNWGCKHMTFGLCIFFWFYIS